MPKIQQGMASAASQAGSVSKSNEVDFFPQVGPSLMRDLSGGRPFRLSMPGLCSQ
jgi:hypothetical protein